MANTERLTDFLRGLMAHRLGFLSREELARALDGPLSISEGRPVTRFLTRTGRLEHDDMAAVDRLVERSLSMTPPAGSAAPAASPLDDLAHTLESASATPDGATIDSSLDLLFASSTCGVEPRDDTARTPAPLVADDSGDTLESDAPTARAKPLAPDRPGTSRFRVIRKHASGGIGDVFLALDDELGREVALKRIQEGRSRSPQSRERFAYEAEITGRLEHPGVVPVYSLGCDELDRPYYAMRFIRGSSLADAIARFHHSRKDRGNEADRGLALRRLLGHFVDLCNTVAYAHSRGVIHRDIKPANVMVGQFGETLVVDWGLARPIGESESAAEARTEASSASDSGRTLPGTALGTPSYMSPEQAAGRLDDLGPPSDVSSLGATLFELLTGQPPYRGESVDDVLSAVQLGIFPRPGEVEPAVPRALEAICLRALERLPEDRYETPQHLADDVERWLAGESVSAWSEPLSLRVGRWLRRHRTVVTSVAVALVIGLVGLGALTALEARWNSVLERRNIELENARGHAEARAGLAVAAVDGFRSVVESNEDIKSRPELEGLRARLLEAPREFYDRFSRQLRQQSATPRTRAQLVDALAEFAELSYEVGDQQAAVEAYREAGTIAQELVEASRSDESIDPLAILARRARIHNGLGSVLRDQDSLEASLDELERGLALRERIFELAPEVPDHVLALASSAFNVGLMRDLEGSAEASRAAFSRARDVLLPLVERASDPTAAPDDLMPRVPVLLSAVLTSLAQDSASRGRPAQAVKMIESALDLTGRLTAPTDGAGLEFAASESAMLAALADARKDLDDTAGALEAMTRSVALQRQATADDSGDASARLDLANRLNSLAHLHNRLGRVDGAVSAAGEARDLLETLTTQHPTNLRYGARLCRTLLSLGSLEHRRGRRAESLALFEDVTARMSSISSRDPTNLSYRSLLAGTWYNIGRLRDELDRYEPALEAYATALEMRRQMLRETPDDIQLENHIAFTLGNMANTLTSLGRLEDASDRYADAATIQRGLVRRSREIPELAVSLSRTLRGRAELERRLGDVDTARALVSESVALLEPLATRHDEVPLYRRDLAVALHTVAAYDARQRRWQEALAGLGRATELLEDLVAASPKQADPKDRLARALVSACEARLALGDFDAAESAATRALELAVSLRASGTFAAEAERTRFRALELRAEAHARRGRGDEAERDWQRRFEGVTLWDRRFHLRDLGPVFIAAWSGQPERARAELAAFTERRENAKWPARVALALARAEALVAAGLTDPEAAEAAAARAVVWIERAVEAGLSVPQPRLHETVEFDSLEARQDFKALDERLRRR